MSDENLRDPEIPTENGEVPAQSEPLSADGNEPIAENQTGVDTEQDDGSSQGPAQQDAAPDTEGDDGPASQEEQSPTESGSSESDGSVISETPETETPEDDQGPGSDEDDNDREPDEDEDSVPEGSPPDASAESSAPDDSEPMGNGADPDENREDFKGAKVKSGHLKNAKIGAHTGKQIEFDAEGIALVLDFDDYRYLLSVPGFHRVEYL